MKKVLAILLALTILLCAGCSSPEISQLDSKTEIIVFAAASLQETLTEIGELYATVEPDVSLVFNFDSSGTLRDQILSGADCDVFISASQKQMNDLDGLLLENSRLDLLENKVTLCVPEGNPKNVTSFDDLAQRLPTGELFLAMGNSDVPVGQYTQKIFTYYDLDEAALASSITYGSNVKEVTTHVAEAVVDCGVIYATDAFSAGLTVVDSATEQMCGQVIYPAAVIGSTLHADSAQAFLRYLSHVDAAQVFAGVGFTPLTEEIFTKARCGHGRVPPTRLPAHCSHLHGRGFLSRHCHRPLHSQNSQDDQGHTGCISDTAFGVAPYGGGIFAAAGHWPQVSSGGMDAGAFWSASSYDLAGLRPCYHDRNFPPHVPHRPGCF